METIKIFLASSKELESDRKAFEDFLYQKSKLWKDERDKFLELRNWEDFVDSVAKTRLQDEYNKAIVDCDIFVLLFWTKVGIYTQEEFNTAYQQFKSVGKPRIYTYYKDDGSSAQKDASLVAFDKMLQEIGHFKTTYKNTEGLLLHFSSQLDKLYRINSGALLRNRPTQLKKAEINEAISNQDYVTVFERMNVFFPNSNALAALRNEFIEQPSNFNLMHFAGRLRVFADSQFDDAGNLKLQPGVLPDNKLINRIVAIVIVAFIIISAGWICYALAKPRPDFDKTIGCVMFFGSLASHFYYRKS